jgi:hypothetical protein
VYLLAFVTLGYETTIKLLMFYLLLSKVAKASKPPSPLGDKDFACIKSAYGMEQHLNFELWHITH